MKRIIVLLVLTVLVSSLVFAAGAREAEVTSREITFVDQNFSYTRAAAEAFKQHVERETNGALTVTILPWEALGSDREVTDQLRLGEVEVYNATTGALSGIIPDVQMTNLPFLFENRYVGWLLFNDEEYLSYVQDHWLAQSNNSIRLLSAAENSIRNLYTTRGPVRTPSELTSYAIKMRVPPIPMYVDLFNELGSAAIVSIPAAERYTAMQAGLMDGTEGGIASAYQAGLLEVAEYVTLTGHMFDHHYYVINNEFYESLSPEFQKIVDDAGRLAGWVQSVGVKASEAESLQAIRDEGITVYEPTPEENAQWREIGVRVGTRLLSEMVAPEYMDVTFEAVERVAANLDMREIEAQAERVARYLD